MTSDDEKKQERSSGQINIDSVQSRLLDEYGSVVQKLNAIEAWAHHFISLYFVFLASIGAATGFVLYSTVSNTGIVDAEIVKWVLKTKNTPVLPEGVSQIFLLNLFALMGIGLNSWAVMMAREYSKSSQILLRHLQAIELDLTPLSGKVDRFASAILATTRSGSFKNVGIFFILVFFLLVYVGWFSLFLFANELVLW